MEMAGYGLTERAASNVRISGLCADPYKVCHPYSSQAVQNAVYL